MGNSVRAVGVIAEYNPFHTGHAYHLAETRRIFGEDTAIVAVMSGNWAQRGECAVVDKWTRAGMALRGGVDLVLELPTPWAISSAEGFARGAVGILRAAGVADALSFGSESGDIDGLTALARMFGREDYRQALGEALKRGKHFAEARQGAAERVLGSTGKLLAGPNDSLAAEYLRAAGDGWKLAAVPRKGASHDSDLVTTDYVSASLLRGLIRQGQWDELSRWTEPDTLRGAGTASMEPIHRAILARLRSMTEPELAALPDSGATEGLPARIKRAARQAGSLSEFYALAKTRRYVHARLRRLALWAFLGLTERDRTDPAYLRVLGMTTRGRALLRSMKQMSSLPILTKPAHIRTLGEQAQKQFALECRCGDLYGLCFPRVRPGGSEYRKGPVVL